MEGQKVTNKSCRDNYSQGASYNLFSHNRSFHENMWGCILSLIIPTALVCVLFAPTIPIYFSTTCLRYLFVYSKSNVHVQWANIKPSTSAEGCGHWVVQPMLWKARCLERLCPSIDQTSWETRAILTAPLLRSWHGCGHKLCHTLVAGQCDHG